MHFEIVCEFRESFPEQNINGMLCSDHPRQRTIEEFQKAIIDCGHTCSVFGGIRKLVSHFHAKTEMPQGIYINLNDGLVGSYARIQAPALLDLLQVPYANSSPFTSALLNNKHFTKVVAHHSGVLVPPGVLISSEKRISSVPWDYSSAPPLITKPNNEGSSIGITENSFCTSEEEAQLQAMVLLGEFDEVLIERYIPGFEVTNLLFGNNREISLNEIIVYGLNDTYIFDHQIMGVKEKMGKKRIPTPGREVLSETILQKIKETSINLASSLGVQDMARFDYRVSKYGDIFLLEVNSLPRIGEDSDAGFIAQDLGISYSQLVGSYLDGVIRRFPKN